ncbi:sensor histidine kinase [Actinomycetospora cinnamomea]|uniref:histidine kinase n=1 Tax=Actinomycetospora cinnamomea TaxID=663609 RepID=A0A2U1F864_9PSEU|nr:HAMP domain-containing sensor histidine kinase [Actinomycetospora cinnamomea]PVZ08170.1 two-component system OmpR family sensor kinase [Actinomycetospora cinnamomea]
MSRWSLGRFPWSVRTLQARIVLATVALLTVVSAVVGVGAVWSLHGYLERQLDEQVKAVSLFRTAPPRPEDDRRPPPPPDAGGGFTSGPERPYGTLEVRATDGGITSAVLLGRRGSDHPVAFDQVAPVIAVRPGAPPDTVDLGELGTYRVMAGTSATAGTVFIGINTAGLDATVSRLAVAEAIIFGLGILLAGIASAFTTRLTLRPLHRVSATARRVAELPLESGEVDLAERVPDVDADPRSEVGQVGVAFNRMLGHVGAALEARQESETRVRRFVADASHELRTPLAAIRGYSELARRRSEEMPPEVAGLLDRVGSQTERMTVLVEDLLLLARLDAGRPLARERIDLTRTVVDAVSDAHVAAPEHSWSLELPGDDADGLDDATGLHVVGDPERLHQVVANLLSNARMHTPPGTHVTTRLARAVSGRGPAVRLEVRDDGPGVPPGLLPHVFERFARGETGRARTTGSTGLGLSIVAAVVAEHGGELEVTSRPGETRFLVTLPAAETAHRRPPQWAPVRESRTHPAQAPQR